MRRNYLSLFIAACLFMVACERSTETTFTPEIKPPKIAKSSKISISDAIKVAMEGISMLDDAKTRAQMRVVDPNKTETYVRPATRSGEADTLFYVINFADSAGFAIIAADSAASPQLLAVAESGNYSPNEAIIDEGPSIPPIDLPVDKYPLPRPRPYPPFTPFVPDTTITYSDWVTAGPYLEVKWGQEDPYNKFCEMLDNINQMAYTGCTATALAQILSYYQYPEEMEITFTKDPEYSQFYNHPEIGNFLTLDWSALKQHVVSLENVSYSEANHINLAILFRQLGQLLGTEYKDDPESKAPFGNIVDVLTGFGYTSNYQGNYNWDLARSELDSTRVVAMSGVRVVNGEDKGHVWVVDGYKSRTKITNISGKEYTETHNYLHINWGWDGSGNGYYLSGIFNTDQYLELDENVDKVNSRNYNKELSMITGIKSPIQNND